MNKEKGFWGRVSQSDESKIKLFNHSDQKYVWSRKGEAFSPQNTEHVLNINVPSVPNISVKTCNQITSVMYAYF